MNQNNAKLPAQGVLLWGGAAALLVALALVSLQDVGAEEHQNGVTKAIAVLKPTEGNAASGTVTFTQTSDGVLIEAQVMGLAPGKHGFHIHEFGDISSPDGKSAGGHFNPEGHNHAGPDAEKRHVGDLGNLEADEKGQAKYRRVDDVIRLNGMHAIVGRGVVVHAGHDDLASQPTGAAGGRIAVGVIGIAKAAH